jgi:hypothetical protein
MFRGQLPGVHAVDSTGRDHVSGKLETLNDLKNIWIQSSFGDQMEMFSPDKRLNPKPVA